MASLAVSAAVFCGFAAAAFASAGVGARGVGAGVGHDWNGFEMVACFKKV